MIDINNLINTAIINAVNAAVEARLEAINAVLQVHANSIDTLAKQTKPEIDLDNLRALVAPMVESMVDAKIEEAIESHQDTYNHEEYDRIVNEVDELPDLNDLAEKADNMPDFDEFVKNDDLPDFDDFVSKDDLDDKIKDAVNNLTFEVSVS